MGPRTFGHFGRAGGFIVVDPDRSLGVCTLGDEPFGPRMLEVWPVFLEALCAESS
jgi:CubicO group peptidase (beta-lactamase class C family)